jgi:hypothetical protein
MGRRAFPALASLVASLGAVLGAAPAHAGDGESALGLSAVYAGLTIPEHEPEGGGLVLDYRRGVTDVVWLRGSLTGAALSHEGGTSYLGQGVVGLTYALDILKYVPYVDLGLAATIVGGGGLDREVHPSIEAGVGLDVLVGRSLSWGPVARVAAFLDDSTLVSLGLRASYRWGFF